MYNYYTYIGLIIGCLFIKLYEKMMNKAGIKHITLELAEWGREYYISTTKNFSDLTLKPTEEIKRLTKMVEMVKFVLLWELLFQYYYYSSIISVMRLCLMYLIVDTGISLYNFYTKKKNLNLDNEKEKRKIDMKLQEKKMNDMIKELQD